jgi:hypothetical protein
MYGVRSTTSSRVPDRRPGREDPDEDGMGASAPLPHHGPCPALGFVIRDTGHGPRPRVKAPQALLADLGHPGAWVLHHDVIGATGRDADDNDQGDVSRSFRLGNTEGYEATN